MADTKSDKGNGRTRTRKNARPSGGPTARERIDWLLGFLQRDVADLRAGELLDVSTDYANHVFPASADEFPEVEDVEDLYTGNAADVAFEDLPETQRPQLQRFQDCLRAGMVTLHRGEDWAPFKTTVPAVAVTYRPVHGGLVRRYAGHKDLDAVAVVYAADLLVTFWSEIRRCKRRGCGVFFIPTHGLQQFHDQQCWDVIRRQRASSRQRDHKAEMIRRHELATSQRTKTGRKR
ncbi:MAG: hypothetical protein AB7H93_13290 [Vicinamibacterales bacterium]